MSTTFERDMLMKLFHVIDHDKDGIVEQVEMLAFMGHLYHDNQYCTLDAITKDHSEEAFAAYLFLKCNSYSTVSQMWCSGSPTVRRCSWQGDPQHH